MTERLSHERLVGLKDWDLRMMCGEATHQHYKGGLYKYVGPVHDADTGSFMRSLDGDFYEGYIHVYPYERQLWVRKSREFNGVLADGSPRFRKIT